MGTNVFANNKEFVSKGADGKSVAAFPDVCWTPPAPPVGPIPIPYPNSTEDKDLDNGTTTVQIKDKTVCMGDTSYIAKSKGDEGATQSQQKGMLTGGIQGKGYFITYSQDVKVEGKGATRHLDMMTHNHSCPGETSPQAQTTGDGDGKSESIDNNNSSQVEPLEIISVALTRRNVVDADGTLKTLNIVSADKVQKSNEFYQNNKDKTKEFQSNKKDIIENQKDINNLEKINLDYENKISGWKKQLEKSNSEKNKETLNKNIRIHNSEIQRNQKAIKNYEGIGKNLNEEGETILSSSVEYTSDSKGCIQFINMENTIIHETYNLSLGDSTSAITQFSDKRFNAYEYINVPDCLHTNTPILSTSMLGRIVEFQVLLNRGHVSSFDSITIILEKKECKEVNNKFSLSENFEQVAELKNQALLEDVVVYSFRCLLDQSCFTSYRVTAFVCDNNKNKIPKSAVESVCLDTWKKIIYTKSIIDGNSQYQGMKTRVDDSLAKAKIELQDLRIDMQELLELNIYNSKNNINFLIDKNFRKTVAAEITKTSIPEAKKVFLTNNRFICHMLFLEHANTIKTNPQDKEAAISSQIINIRYDKAGAGTGNTIIQLNKTSPANALVNQNLTEGGCLVDIKDSTGISILKDTPITNSNYISTPDNLFIKINYLGEVQGQKKYRMHIAIPAAAKKNPNFSNPSVAIDYILYDIAFGIRNSSRDIIVATCADRLNDYSSNPPAVSLLDQGAIENILLHEIGHLLGAVNRPLKSCVPHCLAGMQNPPSDPPTPTEISNANCLMFPANVYEGAGANNRKYFCSDCKKELIGCK